MIATPVDTNKEVNFFCMPCGERNHSLPATSIIIDKTLEGEVSIHATCPVKKEPIEMAHLDDIGSSVGWNYHERRMHLAGAKIVLWRAPEGVTSVRDL